MRLYISNQCILNEALAYSEYKREMIGDVRCTPGWLPSGHLYDEAAKAPDVTATAVVVPTEHLK